MSSSRGFELHASLIPSRCDVAVGSHGVEFGSLTDCIKRRPEPEERIRVKPLLDAVKALAYLNNNSVLDRDIKPDNVPVFVLNKVIAVTGTPANFGSSRNNNTLMQT